MTFADRNIPRPCLLPNTNQSLKFETWIFEFYLIYNYDCNFTNHVFSYWLVQRPVWWNVVDRLKKHINAFVYCNTRVHARAWVELFRIWQDPDLFIVPWCGKGEPNQEFCFSMPFSPELTRRLWFCGGTCKSPIV